MIVRGCWSNKVPCVQDSSTHAAEAGGGYATRRGHGPHLSISDPSHHVTEAIGHMYNDDDYDKRDSRRLSYISSPLSESITTIPPNLAGSASPTSPQSLQLQSHLHEVNTQRQENVDGRPTRPPLVTSKSFDRDSSPGSPGSSNTDTATTSFPLNDVDYESNPAAVAQELNNLAAIRRMSMDAAATGDPDLPDFASSMPSIAPSPSADENDASRLFWVPARLHPELAPKEFKSFLDSKSERIKRRSSDVSSSLSPEGPSSGGGLQRKRSMLSKEIDNSHGYTDGAERLERKRSQTNNKDPSSPNLLELESLVDDSNQSDKSGSSLLNDMQNLGLGADEDKPILPPTPQAPGLRRSTRTQYRKAGSMRKGERPPYSKRFAKSPESNSSLSIADQPILGLTRVSTDPTPSATRAQALSKSTPSVPAQPLASNTSSVSATTLDQTQPENNQQVQSPAADSGKGSAPSLQSRQWQSRRTSNERSSPEQKIPAIVETPPTDSSRATAGTSAPQGKSSRRGSESQSNAPKKSSSLHEHGSSKRSGHSRHQGKDGSSSLNEFANNPQLLPGNSTRTDSLSFIPTFSEDRKSEGKKKERKDSEGGSRKSSWHWLLGNEEKDKDKEKKKDKDSDSKKIKAKLVDKVHDSTNSSPSSSDNSQRGRESFAMDRPDSKLDDERKKDNSRRTSGESKKEKESGLFSSIFGGGRKKHNSDHHHKKSSSRTLSPDPPIRILRPDVDYPWTRFSILEERAIYRMAHIKLANPRRALHSQVLLSNFMYSYLAKVQQMHPHMVLATSAAQRQQQARQQQEEEYLQYQRYQEVSVVPSFEVASCSLLTHNARNSNMVTFMMILRCTTMVMTRMTTTGHIQAVTRTAIIRTVRGIIIMDIRHSVMMSSSTTTTITTCGDK